MRIAVLAPISWRVPPRHYGPWELFASLLTEGLVSRGHEVTLFATGDSLTSARLCSVITTGWSEDVTVDPKVAECLHISQVFERATEFDIIHNSFDFLPLTYARLVATPVVTTIHGFSSQNIIRVYEKYNSRVAYVAISDSDRHPSLDYAATIYHGIDTARFTLHPAPGGYLAFFGRIHPDKGVLEAIETARHVGLPLRMAGIIQDQEYFDREIRPQIDGQHVQFLGPVLGDDRSKFLGGACALLHLIGFDEPFGFSVVESMASGTPVIAFRRGSMPEIIDEGVTGMIVDDVTTAVAAVGRVQAFDRTLIQATAVSRFGCDRMVEQYIAVYKRLIESAGDAGRLRIRLDS